MEVKRVAVSFKNKFATLNNHHIIDCFKEIHWYDRLQYLLFL